jgi:hypothetical protein
MTACKKEGPIDFFARYLDRFAQDFRFHRLFAEHALQLRDLGTRGSQFACWHH